MVVEFDVRIECGAAIGARHKSLARVRSHVFGHFESFGELLLAVQPPALHRSISVVLLMRFDLVNAMAAHVVEIVLDEFEFIATLLPQTQIFGFGVADHVAASRVVHTRGQWLLFQQQLFALRFQIRHIHMV